MKELSNRIDYGSITTSAYNTWTLNTFDLTNISKTGVSKFGMAEGHDVLDNAPTTLLSSNDIRPAMAETAGTTQDPTLTVVHGTQVATTIATLQDITYTYDAVGNITQLTDNGTSGAGKTVVFAYDDLHRMTSASTTAASSTPFIRTYTYSILGNIATSSDQGEYYYAGTNYANPHAATSINGTSLTYDNNGNLTAYGALTLGETGWTVSNSAG